MKKHLRTNNKSIVGANQFNQLNLIKIGGKNQMKDKISGDFRKYMNKNYLGSWDVPETSDLIATIEHVVQEEVSNAKGKELKLTIHFQEDLKPMILNTTNAQSISKVVGSTKVESWAGQRIAIFTSKVSAFGATVEALRIRDYEPKAETYICKDCGKEIEPFKNYTARQMAERAKSKFGRYLCMDCATAASEAEAAAKKEGDVLNEDNEG